MTPKKMVLIYEKGMERLKVIDKIHKIMMVCLPAPCQLI
jgi:hypothetical protein